MKFNEWTDSQLKELASDNRKLKSIAKRMPKTGMTNKELAKCVAEKSGFQKKDVYEIFKALKEVLFDAMQNKQRVKLEGVCTFYPLLKKARQGTCLSGGKSTKQMIVPPHYKLMMLRNDAMSDVLKDMDITLEDVEEIYA